MFSTHQNVFNPPWFMLYLLCFLFLSKFKPTNVLNRAAFLRDIFLSNLQPINRFNVAKVRTQTSNKLKNYKHWYNLHCLERYKTINALADAVITAKFVPCENQTYKWCQWSCLFVRCVFF